jgi:hypothetical protein
MRCANRYALLALLNPSRPDFLAPADWYPLLSGRFGPCAALYVCETRVFEEQCLRMLRLKGLCKVGCAGSLVIAMAAWSSFVIRISSQTPNQL